MINKISFFNLFLLLILLPVLFFFSCLNTSTEKKNEFGKDDAKITFSNDIAPIIFKNCTPCHRPGESGPMSLTSYDQVKAVSNKIKFVTQSRFMPPWPADPNYSHFIGERVLSNSDIEKIKIWVNNGSPEGDRKKCPPLPEFTQGSFFGKPDMVIQMQKPIEIKGNGQDRFLMIKLPYEIEKDTFVRFFEFVPYKRKLVHHVNGHLITYDEKRKFNAFKGESILPDAISDFEIHFKRMNLEYTDGKKPEFPTLFTNAVYYLPGYVPPAYPKGVGGYFLSKSGAILLKNVHYGPSAKNEIDSSCINVFFSKEKPSRPLRELQIGTFGLSPVEPELIIPPNQIKTFHSKWAVPETISLLSVNPHMHLLGKSFLAFAVTPVGDTIKLIKIKKWDFRWQYYYTFNKMIKIPKGSVIHAFGTFDNTEKNPFNPFYPPREIKQGDGLESMQTTEEMFQFIFTFLPYRAGDENLSLK